MNRLNTTARRNKRARLVKLQNNKCFYCNCKMLWWKTKATLDHIEPFCKVWNKTKFVASCFNCNKLKWNIDLDLFLDWYICVNFKYGFDSESENKAMKVRNKINWFQKTFPSIFPRNKYYKLTIKLYD